MRLQPLLAWTHRLLWSLLVVAMVSAAALVSLGRYYAGYVERYQAEIIEEVRRRTGLDLHASSLRAEWSRWSPVLHAREVRLRAPAGGDHDGQDVLKIAAATVRVDPVSSLVARAPRLGVVELEGLELTLEEHRLGHWRLAGFKGRGDNPELDPVLDALLAIDRLQADSSRVNLQLAAGGRVALQGHQLGLQRAGAFRRLNLSMAFVAGGAPLDIILEAHGDPRDRHFRAQGYASFSGVDLGPILPAAEGFGLVLEQGRIDGRLWAEWHPDQALSLRGEVGIAQLDLAALSGRPIPAMEQVELQFRLRQQADTGWQAWLPSLRLRLGGEALTLAGLELSGQGLHQLHLATAQLELRPLQRAVLGAGLLDALPQEALATLAPEGRLANLHLTLDRDAAAGQHLQLRGELSDISVQPWRGAPGGSGISGYLSLDLQGGYVELASAEATLSFPEVYRDPLAFEALHGRVGWRIEPDRVSVHSGLLVAQAAAGTGRALLALDLPIGQSEQHPQMTLAIGMRDTEARHRGHYLPYILPDTLLDWLAASVGDAQLPEVAFVYRGALTGAASGRTVQVGFDVRDGQLDYHPDWPALHAISARGVVSDDQVRIVGQSAQGLHQARLGAVEVALEQRPQGPWLRVDGDIALRDADLPALLEQPGMRRILGNTFDGWTWQGRAEGQLQLGIPLQGGDAEISVRADVAPGRLGITPLNLTLEEVAGPLRYDNDRGLYSSGLQARLFQRPVRAVIGRNGHDQFIEAEAEVHAADVRDWLNLPLLAPLQGSAGVRLHIHLPPAHSSDRPMLTLDSDLQGVGIDLPAPLGKAADEPAALSLALPLDGGPARTLHLRLAQRLGMALRWDGDGIHALAARLGDTGIPALEADRLLLVGGLPTLHADAWTAAYQRYRDILRQPGGETPGLPITVRGFHVEELDVAGQRLHDLTLDGRFHQGRWRGRIEGRELAGQVHLPHAGRPLALNIDRLQLPLPRAGHAGDTPGTQAGAAPDPARLIDIDVTIGELFWEGERLGGIGFELRRLADGIRLQRLAGNLRGISIAGQEAEQGATLDWRQGASGPYTRAQGRLLAGNLAEVLANWGYEGILVSRHSQMDVDVDWPGGPAQFALAATSGTLHLRVDEGRFLRAPATTSGTLRVVGIFNLANLLRRLRLDFTDIFGAGVSFDRLQADLVFDDGLVLTRSPLSITSPSTNFHASGQLDFNTDQVDMELAATLPIASNLPWVAALAGGLPAAAGVYIMSKVFESQVDRYSRAVYRLSGDWHDPQVEFLRVFDPGDARQ